MSAAKLAEYAGMPRPTVIRKLDRLERIGLVRLVDKRRAILVGDMVGTEAAREATEVFTRIINDAATELAKLDRRRRRES